MCFVVVGTSTPVNRLFLEKLTVARPFKEFAVLYGIRKFKNCLEEYTTEPCSEPDESKFACISYFPYMLHVLPVFFSFIWPRGKYSCFLVSQFLKGWRSRTYWHTQQLYSQFSWITLKMWTGYSETSLTTTIQGIVFQVTCTLTLSYESQVWRNDIMENLLVSQKCYLITTHWRDI